MSQPDLLSNILVAGLFSSTQFYNKKMASGYGRLPFFCFFSQLTATAYFCYLVRLGTKEYQRDRGGGV